ncbi:MAG: SpoIID/LytB domain-containing protein [Oscillatoriales cyanobacterium SM2_1_8]|nr:SpoIID/LytB domain-containing protein [Oscillatoriales cyanobacterium SM2_1_8]
MGTIALMGAGLLAVAGGLPRDNPELQIGIGQRFGENARDTLTLSALPGDRLTLEFAETIAGDRPQRVTVPQVTVTIAAENLPTPGERQTVILSHHRSYENAAASAFRLTAQGIPTDIVQPRRWQVWAKRDTFQTVPLRQVLMQELHAQGFERASLETRRDRQRLGLSWQAGNFRYRRDRLTVRAGNGVVRVNGRPYGGRLVLQPNAFGTFTVVNWVPLETYLRGVVPHEIGSQAPFAAVQAQAILARSYALASRQRFVADNYELCATTQCQVYRGLEGTSAYTDRAIASTRGLVLTHQGQIIDALYSSTTGGITANYHDLWDGATRPYLKSVWDAPPPPPQRDLSDEANFQRFIALRQGFHEEGWSHFRWQKESSLDEIRKTLGAFLQMSGDRQPPPREIRSLQITKRAPSGRVQAIAVETENRTLTIEKDEIIDAFAAPNSLLFYLEPKMSGPTLQGYRFRGGGLGHGVGMSQTGSYTLARRGFSFAQILDFYYTDTRLQPLPR